MNRRLLPALASLLLAPLAMAAEPLHVTLPAPAAAPAAAPASTAAATAAAPTGALPDARKILRDFFEASGGSKAFDSMRNLVMEATQSMPAGTISIYVARPNLVLMREDFEGLGKFEQGFDGTLGWELNPVMGSHVLEGSELEDMKQQFAETLGMSDLDKIYATATTVGREPFQGKDAYKVLLGTASGRMSTAYFDPVTKMQVGLEVKVQSPLGELPATMTFEDYTDFGGFKLPRTTRETAMGIASVTTVNAVKVNVADFPKISPPPEILELVANPSAAAAPDGE